MPLMGAALCERIPVFSCQSLGRALRSKRTSCLAVGGCTEGISLDLWSKWRDKMRN